MGLKECRWCGEMVDPENCFASMGSSYEPQPIVGGDTVVWVCSCGKEAKERKASSS